MRARVSADLGLDADRTEALITDLWTEYLGAANQESITYMRTLEDAAPAPAPGDHPDSTAYDMSRITKRGGGMELLTIGAFAKAARLSPKALRLYDELGLLPPARVDPATGYRYYARRSWNGPGWWRGCAGSGCRSPVSGGCARWTPAAAAAGDPRVLGPGRGRDGRPARFGGVPCRPSVARHARKEHTIIGTPLRPRAPTPVWSARQPGRGVRGRPAARRRRRLRAVRRAGQYGGDRGRCGSSTPSPARGAAERLQDAVEEAAAGRGAAACADAAPAIRRRASPRHAR